MKVVTVLFFLFSILFISACGGGSPSPASIETKSISVGWNIPTTRVNGESLGLSAIGGYKIYLATSNDVSPKLYTTITNTSTTSYTLTNLSSGTYYIYLTTYDVNGDESPLSNRISKTI